MDEKPLKSAAYGESEASRKNRNRLPIRIEGIGTRIKAVAELLGSRSEAASAAGISEDMLYRYMREETQPPFGAMAALCSAADASLDWLATGEGTMRRDIIQEQRAGYRLGRVDPRLLQDIVLLAEKVAEDEQLDPTPEQKAKFVAGIYDYVIEQGISEQTELARVVRLVVSNAA